MEITKEMLISCGIDPALYSKEDMKKIGEAADRLAVSSLGEILSSLSAPDPDELALRHEAEKARSQFNQTLSKINQGFDSIAKLCSVKSSIFSSVLTDGERTKIFDGSSRMLGVIDQERTEAISFVEKMYDVDRALSEILNVYNRCLYDAGLINVAVAVTGKSDEGIYEALESAFDRFNSLTEFVNDLSDRAIIGDKAMNIKLVRHLEVISDALDPDGNGKALNTQKILNEIISAKSMITDVIER